jgi:hypothetical protein
MIVIIELTAAERERLGAQVAEGFLPLGPGRPTVRAFGEVLEQGPRVRVRLFCHPVNLSPSAALAAETTCHGTIERALVPPEAVGPSPAIRYAFRSLARACDTGAPYDITATLERVLELGGAKSWEGLGCRIHEGPTQGPRALVTMTPRHLATLMQLALSGGDEP